MKKALLRVLLVADTHLGYDLPARPRVERRRRGPDFFLNLDRALAAVYRSEVDLVVHGGDLLFRSKVPPSLVERALAPLIDVADTGVPVILVPGNHERSGLPFPLLAAHPRLFVFDRPRTFTLSVCGIRVAVAGFPCVRSGIRDRFGDALGATSWREVEAQVRLLAVHQSVEGARVGPVDYCFRSGPDVLRGRDLPDGFAAVLAGHIHRHQVLVNDLAGRELAAPVFYPGAIERTSMAERSEAKGYLTLLIEAGSDGGRVREWAFHELPTRPMDDLRIDISGRSTDEIENLVRERLEKLPADAVVKVRVSGTGPPEVRAVLSAPTLRAMAPPTMTVEVRWLR